MAREPIDTASAALASVAKSLFMMTSPGVLLLMVSCVPAPEPDLRNCRRLDGGMPPTGAYGNGGGKARVGSVPAC